MSKLAIVILLGACGMPGSPVTQHVATLGYTKPPTVAIVTRGAPDLVDPWVASLKKATTIEVLAELSQPGAPTEKIDTHALCGLLAEPHVDEILVITASPKVHRDSKCIKTECGKIDLFAKDPGPWCYCARHRHKSTEVTITSRIYAIRTSSCEVIRTTTLPVAVAISTAAKGEEYVVDLTDRINADADVARATAVARIAQAAPHLSWNVFPRGYSIASTEGRNVVVQNDPRHPLVEGRSYFVKLPSGSAMYPGARVVQADPTSATLAIDESAPLPTPGDELHIGTDVRRAAAYLSLAGGVLDVQNGRHGAASASGAVRWSFDRMPVMTELQFVGEVIPGLSAARLSFGGAAGFRLPIKHVSPVAFGELGLGEAYQSSPNARAFGGYFGTGVGLEVWYDRLFLFADMRRRWFRMEDWHDKEDKPVDVRHPDKEWITTTIAVGVGGRL